MKYAEFSAQGLLCSMCLSYCRAGIGLREEKTTLDPTQLGNLLEIV